MQYGHGVHAIGTLISCSEKNEHYSIDITNTTSDSAE